MTPRTVNLLGYLVMSFFGLVMLGFFVGIPLYLFGAIAESTPVPYVGVVAWICLTTLYALGNDKLKSIVHSIMSFCAIATIPSMLLMVPALGITLVVRWVSDVGADHLLQIGLASWWLLAIPGSILFVRGERKISERRQEQT